MQSSFEPWLDFLGDRVRIRLDGAATGGRYAILECRKRPGSATPVHMHAADSETVYVLSGQLQGQTQAGLRVIAAGDAATLAPGAPHRLANPSDAEARYVLLCAPAGFEDLVREVCAPVAGSDAAPDLALQVSRLPVAAARHGVTLLPDAVLPETAEAADRVDTPRAERLDLMGIELAFLAELGTGDDATTLVLARFPPHARVPLHSHAESEAFVILDGALDIFRGDVAEGAWLRAEPGDVVGIGPHRPHAVRNAADGWATVLTVAQGRLADFFRQAARPPDAPGGPPTPQEIGAVLAIGARFGFWNADAADNARIGLSP